jgi:hypothetical protein
MDQLSEQESKQHAADVLGIPVSDVLGVAWRDGALIAVTAAGQKVRLDEDGVTILTGPGSVPETVEAEPLPEASEEPQDLDEFPPLEEVVPAPVSPQDAPPAGDDVIAPPTSEEPVAGSEDAPEPAPEDLPPLAPAADKPKRKPRSKKPRSKK